MIYLVLFLLVISLVSGTIFAHDKRAAICGKRRTPERTLHLLELCGGVFVVWALIYLLHHKNRKLGYYGITYLILALWIALLVGVFRR